MWRILARMDAESKALKELAGRATRLRVGVGLAFLTLGLAAGAVGYWLVANSSLFVRDGYRALGWPIALFSGAVGFAPPLLLAMVLGRSVGRALVERRRDGWAAELAARYELDAESLREAGHLY
jgi:hypothetical protein